MSFEMSSMEQPPAEETPQEQEIATEAIVPENPELKAENPVENFVHTKVFETFGLGEKSEAEKQNEQKEKNEAFPVVDEVAERSPDNAREMLSLFFKYHCDEGRPERKKYFERELALEKQTREKRGIAEDESIDWRVSREMIQEVSDQVGSMDVRKEDKEALLKKLSDVYDIVKQSTKLTLNKKTVTRLLDSGKFTPFAEIGKEERAAARKVGTETQQLLYNVDPEGYDERRDARERDLGIYEDHESKPIYMALSSEYHDELKRGAAPQFGPFVVTVNPERVKNRVVCTAGDSMNVTGLITPFSSLRGEDGSARKQQLSFEHALLAKAMYEVHHDLLRETDGSRNGKEIEGYEPGRMQYIEAQILGGLTTNDIETISIPKGKITDKEMQAKGTNYYKEKYPDLIVEK